MNQNELATKRTSECQCKGFINVKNSITKGDEMTSSVIREKLLTAAAVGEMLSLSKRQIFRLNSSGKIPAPVRIGGSVRFIESEISAWLQAGAPDRRTWNFMRGGK